MGMLVWVRDIIVLPFPVLFMCKKLSVCFCCCGYFVCLFACLFNRMGICMSSFLLSLCLHCAVFLCCMYVQFRMGGFDCVGNANKCKRAWRVNALRVGWCRISFVVGARRESRPIQEHRHWHGHILRFCSSPGVSHDRLRSSQHRQPTIFLL